MTATAADDVSHGDDPHATGPAAVDQPPVAAAGSGEYHPSADEEFMNPRQQAFFRRKLLDWKDAILREDPKGPYVNLIAVRSEDKDKPWVKALVEAYGSPEVKKFVEEKFKGSVLTSW